MADKKYPILEVLWEDITEQVGWYSREISLEKHIKAEKIITIGIKIKETKKYLYLTNCFNEEDWGALTIIPKGVIKNIKVIGYVKEPS